MSMVYTYDGTNSSCNLTPATAGEAMFRLKQTLLQAGWTVISSGNATTYGNSDLITTSTLMATTNAWVVLRQHTNASGTRQICIQKGSTASCWNAWYSFSAGFTTGGSATVRPTATDEKVLINVTTTGALLFGTDGTYRMSIGAENTDSAAFYAVWFPTGGGNPSGMFVLDYMVAATAVSDNDPYVFYTPYNTAAALPSNVGLWNSGNAASGIGAENTAGQGCYGWYKKGLSGETWASMSPWGLSNAAVVVPNLVGPNPYTNKDEAFPMFFGRRAALATPGFKGLGTLMKWNGANRSTGDTLSVASSSAKDRIVVGNINLPWNGSTPSV